MEPLPPTRLGEAVVPDVDYCCCRGAPQARDRSGAGVTAAQRPTVERAPERHREGPVPGPTKEALEAGAAGPTEWRHGPLGSPVTTDRGSSEGASYETIPEARAAARRRTRPGACGGPWPCRSRERRSTPLHVSLLEVSTTSSGMAAPHSRADGAMTVPSASIRTTRSSGRRLLSGVPDALLAAPSGQEKPLGL